VIAIKTITTWLRKFISRDLILLVADYDRCWFWYFSSHNDGGCHAESVEQHLTCASEKGGAGVGGERAGAVKSLFAVGVSGL